MKLPGNRQDSARRQWPGTPPPTGPLSQNSAPTQHLHIPTSKGQIFRLTAHALTLAWLLGLCGCAGYQLGPVNGMSAGERSIQVNPFSNQTLQGRLSDPVTAQVRKELQRDGTFKLATHDDGDVILTGVITHYDRGEVTLSSNDILTVRDYRLSLIAEVTARERATGKVLFSRQNVTGYTLIRVGSDLTSAERQAMPLLADDLAKNLTALLVEGKW